ncbi:MAG: helix-turn-helix domain-containing protein [Chloroflexaceae bacterium]|nr:helix-turn-helix domain-containing protein [Chloroflexaceae bacterium]
MLSTRQAAERLGVSERQVLRYVHAQMLEAEQLGTNPNAPWMITDESLERLLTQRRDQAQRRHSGRKTPSPQQQST